MEKRKKQGFTLIELLIVVAIIAILAAIAVPNFLEAQVRSKVSKSVSNMRTYATAMEAYNLDENRYPPIFWVSANFPEDSLHCLWRLTTPVAYLTDHTSLCSPFIIQDPPSGEAAWWTGQNSYWYFLDPEMGLWCDMYEGVWLEPLHIPKSTQWMLSDAGPNMLMWANEDFYDEYDASNGTMSNGNLYRWGP